MLIYPASDTYDFYCLALSGATLELDDFDKRRSLGDRAPSTVATVYIDSSTSLRASPLDVALPRR